MGFYSVVFTSLTGNTKLLAEEIRGCVGEEGLVYWGEPLGDDVERFDGDELVFVGFWTDKGGCDERIGAYLEGLRNRKVFLFGTAGFGGSEEYFEQILDRVKVKLTDGNEVVGSFMCQGRMPESVRRRYEAGLGQQPQKMQEMIENFDRAALHPDEEDLKCLRGVIENVINGM